MASSATEETDWEAEGLVAHSYDGFFRIDKRIRKFGDVYVPTRTGISVNQFVTFIVVLFASFLFEVLITGPVMAFLHIPSHWLFFLLRIFGPPLIASWRVTQPMPYGKTIPGTVTSLLTYYCDDTTHRRGMPVPPKKVPDDVFVQHYMRDWTVNREFADEIAGEGDWTDAETERRRARGAASEVAPLQDWMDRRAIEHWREQQSAKNATTKVAITPNNPRGRVATVSEF